MNGYIRKQLKEVENGYSVLASFDYYQVVVDELSQTYVDEDFAIAFDGDIYAISGHQNLKKEEVLKVIASLYETKHNSCFSGINGAFSILLVDKRENKVLMVRDHVGLSSFYHSQSSEGTFFFSTHFDWMMHNVSNKTINTDALFQVMHHLYTLAPATIINEISKLRPASILEWSRNGMSITKYWDIEQIFLEGKKNQIRSFNEAKKQLTELIKDAINIRYKEADTGIMLSSGIDSSLVTALSSDTFKTDISTLTIGVEDKRFNESVVAKNIADYLGVKNSTLYMDEDKMAEIVNGIVDACPEPMGDSGIIPNLYIVKRAKEKFKYVMGGDGGDEIFSGYPHYAVVDKAQKYDWVGAVLNSLLPTAIKIKLPASLRRVIENRSPYNKTQILLKSETDSINRLLKKPCDYKGDSMDNPEIKSWRERRMIHDIQTSLVDEMIYKAVGCANYAGVKVLSPLLDYRVLELSCRIPLEFKYKNGITKHILRQIDYDHIPQEILDVPKRGFVLPIDKLLKTTLSYSIERFINKEFLEEQGLFRYDCIFDIYQSFLSGNRSFQRKIWTFYVFQLWYEKYQGLLLH